MLPGKTRWLDLRTEEEFCSISSFLSESKKLILIWTLWTWVSPDVCILCLQASKFRPNLELKLSFVKERAIVLQGSWIAWISSLKTHRFILKTSHLNSRQLVRMWSDQSASLLRAMRRYLRWKRKADNRKRMCCYQLAQLVVIKSGLLVLNVKKQNALQWKALLWFPDGHLENIQNWACQVTKMSLW